MNSFQTAGHVVTFPFMGRFDETYRRSLEQPEAFWSEAAAAIDWDKPWERVLDDSRAPFYRWFTGGRLNTCHNALDRHVENGRAEQTALIYDSPVTETVARFTYRELRDAVARFAGALAAQGVERGDRVIVYMPMVPEAVIAMLACARLGAIHSVVFGGFAANELASRIEDARPKVVVSASCGIEPGRTVEYKPLLDEAIGAVESKPERCIVLQRPMLEAELDPQRDVEWHEALEGAEPADCVSLEATDPLYIIYTSGTTGQPKGIVRDNGGHAVALAWSMKAIYDVDPGEVYWAASAIGWTVGHSYTVYAPLFHGCTTVLYEGKPVGTPDAGAFWRVIEQHGVCTLFTAPTAFRAIRQQDPEGEHIGRHDLSGFPGYYQTADAGYVDENGYVFVMARTDDIINVAGHRLSTGAIEDVLAAHPDVAECAVVGVADDLKGQVPLGLLVLKAGVERDHAQICDETVQLVRDRIGPVAV